MKILVLTSSYPRFPGDGTAPFVKSLAENMVKLGHDVHVLAPYDPKVQAHDQTHDIEEVKVHRFRYVIPKRYHIMGHAQAMEADVKLRPLSYLLLPFFLLAEFIQLLRIAMICRSEIIHVHWVLPNGPVAALGSMILRIPFVLSLHGSDVFIAKRNKLFGWVAGWVYKRASAVTACSAELRDAAISQGAADKVHLIAWGADPEIFKPSESSRASLTKFGLNEDQFIVSALGRMVYKKGFDRLIESWEHISRQFPDARLLIGGDGPVRKELIAKSHNLGIEDRIVFTGSIEWDKVPEFLSSTDLFILPSIRDESGNIDGLPTVLLEAMACGVPVIASQLGGIPLVIEDGYNGILVPPGDVDALSLAIQGLIDEDKLRLTIGKQARADIVNIYNWMNVVKVFIESFEKAIWRKNTKTRMGSIYRDEMVRLLRLRSKGGRALDVGCHDGLFLNELDAILKIGVDSEPLRGAPKINLIKADGCHLPFTDETFDYVYALDVIEHVEADANFARSLLRVSAPGGRLLITTPSHDIKVFPAFTMSLVNRKWGHTLRTGYSQNDLSKLFRNSQFSVNIREWNAPSYRFLYYPVRALFALFPGLTQRLIRALAHWDFKHQNGARGFLILEAHRHIESQTDDI